MFLYGIINHWQAWSLSTVKLIWINNKFTGWHNRIKNVLYFYSCCDCVKEVITSLRCDKMITMMIVCRVSRRSSDGIYQIKVLVSSAGARLNTSVNYIGNSRCELFFDGHWTCIIVEIPMKSPCNMHSTRFRLFSRTQPVTSLLTPSGPPCSGRTLLIRLLSAKSLNITYTRNTTNLRSHNVTGGEKFDSTCETIDGTMNHSG